MGQGVVLLRLRNRYTINFPEIPPRRLQAGQGKEVIRIWSKSPCLRQKTQTGRGGIQHEEERKPDFTHETRESEHELPHSTEQNKNLERCQFQPNQPRNLIQCQ